MSNKSLMERFYQWLEDDYMPPELAKDTRLKHLDIRGPFGKSHDNLRQAYVAITNKQPIPLNVVRRLYKDWSYVCNNSPGLWRRTDDTPKELQIICTEVQAFLLSSKI